MVRALNVEVPVEMHQALKVLAAERKETMATLVAEALAILLKRYERAI